MTENNVLSKFDFPFRVGCTSYVYPGDIEFNAALVAKCFDDIELVFFQSQDACNFPDKKTIQVLCDIAKKHSITYTVHFPIDKKAGSCDESERLGFIKQVNDLMNLTQELNPFAYILHLEGIHRNASSFEKSTWQNQVLKTCEAIDSFAYDRRSKICVENLDYPYTWHKDIVDRFGFSYCMDIGHLLLYNENIAEVAKSILHKTRVLHIHGVCQGKDHISLKNNELQSLVSPLRDSVRLFNGVATIETFSETDTFESLEVLKKIWEK